LKGQKIKVVILQNENPDDSIRWEEACRKRHDVGEVKNIRVLYHNWLEEINIFRPDIILTKPPGTANFIKEAYDERLTILVKELNYFCFPSLEEVLIYENKKYLAYWLKAHAIPSPETHVFYNKTEALEYIGKEHFPIIAKLNIGASGSGITFINSTKQGLTYIENAFSDRGLRRRVGPNFKKKKLIQRGLKYIIKPGSIRPKIRKYQAQAIETQKKLIIFQKYIKHEFEWRVVRIGDSFFAHKKVNKGKMASGALIKEYGKPPFHLLDFVKNISDRFGLFSVAIDIFEYEKQFLVNEIQCIFGQSDPYQMKIDDKPGRYVFIDGKWVFEAGDFNSNESFDLRLKVAIDMFKQRPQ